MPPLLKPQPDRKKKSAVQLFEQVAPSVVVVKAGASTGTGVCIAAKGYILTNDHVIATRPDSIELTAYVWRDGKLSRLASVDGTVVYRSAKHDLAVVKASSAPSTLKPLPFALATPRVGVKVFALGNPGLGRQTLDQTFSDGIISSAERSLKGISFLQHTAAVDGGNSGGPLLNEYGEVVGIVTLKAALENTSFAIPAKRIRGLLNPEEE